MAKGKPIIAQIKLHIPAGQATPAPPVGPALSQWQLNIPDFCKQFNAATSKLPNGLTTPVVITVYKDKTFSFVTKSPPASVLLKQACKIAKGSGTPNTVKVASVTRAQLLDIARQKKADLNAASDEAAIRIIEGTARSMGVTVED
ncbi:50S ribosomal protein L11 [candidate division WOR-3 bacterium]|uniref:Large ribosomal subunit protein uL11 n=1 Tax=candidate division WOR-3 bacterium TaxID=2052148 RepID=A0A9D5QCD4_UNCW3|nr:50S ribosomal protein L11 [candidate division WOR-3 bacterium]MBD3364439.1 50S ribosomal protein L11 [candidate division WOR-3 bacterium]